MLDITQIDVKDGRGIISVAGEYMDLLRLEKYIAESYRWYDLLQRISEGENVSICEINQVLEGR